MKKLLAALLAGTMMVGLASCAKSEPPASSTPATPPRGLSARGFPARRSRDGLSHRPHHHDYPLRRRRNL